MPNIKFSGVDAPTVQTLSHELSKSLSKTIGCPEDWITFIAGESAGKIFCNGEVLTDTIFAYVSWFDRGQEVKNQVAKVITKSILTSDKAELATIETVNVVFIDMKKSDYFENGEHF